MARKILDRKKRNEFLNPPKDSSKDDGENGEEAELFGSHHDHLTKFKEHEKLKKVHNDELGLG